MVQDYNCLSNDLPTSWNIKGVNIGGLFVLEPWITPSLFYQFLNKKDENNVGMDTFSFCKVLGQKEGNRQLNEHFHRWFNESDIKSLVSRKITHIRIPVGDWMFFPYEPYIGCTEGSIQYLNKILEWCRVNKLKVLLDLHGVKGSQNGLDNSGKSSNINYVVAPTNNEYDSALTFIHWSTLAGNWLGDFNTENKTYDKINKENIDFTKQTLYQMVDLYGRDDTVFGIEALNEPWVYTPIDILKSFYYDVYKYMNTVAPHLKFIYHDSFRGGEWDNFLINCGNVAMDWHIYQAWDIERYGDQFLLEADNYEDYIANLKQKGIQMIIGEFSLATDNCAMWLNGFQDNLEGYPVTDCKYIPCPFPYIDIPDFDRIHNIISPFGTGLSSPRFGTCPYEGTTLIIDESYFTFMNKLTQKKLKSFSKSQGWFFWNFKTDIVEETSWNFLSSYDRGFFLGTEVDFTNSHPMFYIYATMIFIIGSIYFVFKANFRDRHHYVSVKVSETQPINKIVRSKIHKSSDDIPKNYHSVDILDSIDKNNNHDEIARV